MIQRTIRAAAGLKKAIGEKCAEKDRTPSPEDGNGSTIEVQTKVGHRIEELAGQIRTLGQEVPNRLEGCALARRLEETADYLRFRPTAEIGRDMVDAARARKKPLYLTAGVTVSLLAGALAYRRFRDS